MRQFHDCNPIAVTLYYLSVTAVTMFTMNPVILLISLISSVLNFCLYTRATRKSHLFSLILFLVLTLLNPLINHNGVTVLFYLNNHPITFEALIYGATAAAMVTASLYWLRLFSSAMSSDKLLYLFGRFSPKIALILSMAIRYVELLRSRWRRIQDAQRALGLYDDGNLIDALRGRARVLSILMTWTLENGIITAEGMDARGYGTGRRTSFALYRVHLPDLILMLITALFTALAVGGITTAHAEYYPAITMQLSDPLSIAGYIGFGILTTVPIIINTKEAIRWRYLRSEI